MNNNKIFEKVKMKIAISNVKEEDIVMNKSKLNIIAKGIGIAACIALSMTGVVFASSKIIESIWKNPEKVNPTYEIIDEIRKKNITIEGSTGQFFAIRNCKEFKQDENKAYTLEEAKEIADKYFKQFGFDKDGFEFTKVQVDVGPDVKKGGEQTRGSRLEVRYNKKYDNQISSSQYVNIVLDTGLEDRFESIMTKNEPFENNEYIITKDEAVSKAKEYDKNRYENS